MTLPLYRVLMRERNNGYPHPRTDVTLTVAAALQLEGVVRHAVRFMTLYDLPRLTLRHDERDYSIWRVMDETTPRDPVPVEEMLEDY